MIMAFWTSAMKRTPRTPPTIRAFAALEARAAEHRGGDDLQLDADAGVHHRAVQPRGVEHAGEPREKPMMTKPIRVSRSTRMPESWRPRVAADEVELPEEARAGDRPAAEQHDRQHHPERRLDAEQRIGRLAVGVKASLIGVTPVPAVT